MLGVCLLTPWLTSKMAGISASALQAVKLKATDQTQDKSAPLYTICKESIEKEEERRAYFFSTGLDQWYKELEDVTIPTTFLTLTPDEAREMVSYWTQYYCHKSSHDSILDESDIKIPPALNSLVERISNMISTFSPDDGVFVKLSTRSPKDSHIAFASAVKSYKSLPSPSSGNDKLITFGDISLDSLRVTNGREAIKLFISSDRVGEDLEYALEPGDKDFDARVSIVIRKWVKIPLWSEFRGFVWDGKLTSIGQYNHPVVFTELLGKTEQIKSDLQAFYDRIKTKIPLQRYIIHFAWVKDHVYLIEINPFDGEIVYPASTGLWSWDEDRDHMMRGELALRVRTEEQSELVLKKTLDPQWRNVLFT